MRLRSTGTLAAATLAAALSALAPAAFADERCYGVAPAGKNDGIDDREAPGHEHGRLPGQRLDLVPDGTCLTQPVPVQPDGTPRRGALEPLDRDRPPAERVSRPPPVQAAIFPAA